MILAYHSVLAVSIANTCLRRAANMRQEVFCEWFPAVGFHFAHTHFGDACFPLPDRDLRQQMIGRCPFGTRFVKHVGAVVVAFEGFAFRMCRDGGNTNTRHHKRYKQSSHKSVPHQSLPLFITNPCPAHGPYFFRCLPLVYRGNVIRLGVKP